MSRDFDSYADAYLRTAKDLESDFKAAAEGAFKRMYAHTCVMRKLAPTIQALKN